MRRNVLVVDDDLAIQELLTFFLEQAGFVVRCCSDGYAAIDELHSNPYDLMILDISMPHMSGIKALNIIRSNPVTKNLPVLMLTGSQDKNDIIRAKKADITDYVVKPPNREDMLKRVERILGGKPQFEELLFTPGDSTAEGAIAVPYFLKSISSHGVILVGDQPMTKGTSIRIQDFGVLDVIGIEKKTYTLTDCVENKDGKYEFFLSFLGLSLGDQEKLREWVIAETYRRKNATPKKAS